MNSLAIATEPAGTRGARRGQPRQVQARIEADEVAEAGHEPAERDDVLGGGVHGHDLVDAQPTSVGHLVQVGAVVVAPSISTTGTATSGLTTGPDASVPNDSVSAA